MVSGLHLYLRRGGGKANASNQVHLIDHPLYNFNDDDDDGHDDGDDGDVARHIRRLDINNDDDDDDDDNDDNDDDENDNDDSEVADHVRGLDQPRHPKLLGSLKGQLAIVLDVVRTGEKFDIVWLCYQIQL